MKQYRIRIKRTVEQTMELTRYYHDQHEAEEYAPWVVPRGAEERWFDDQELSREVEVLEVGDALREEAD